MEKLTFRTLQDLINTIETNFVALADSTDKFLLTDNTLKADNSGLTDLPLMNLRRWSLLAQSDISYEIVAQGANGRTLHAVPIYVWRDGWEKQSTFTDIYDFVDYLIENGAAEIASSPGM